MQHKSRKSSRLKQKQFLWSRKILIWLCVLGGVVAAAILAANEVFQMHEAVNWSEVKAADKLGITFPQDDKTHKAGIEWWYYNGIMQDDAGREYSFHTSLFLINGLNNFRVGHVSLSDHQSKQHFVEQISTPGNSLDQQSRDFNFALGDSLFIRGEKGSDYLQANYKKFAFDLNLNTNAPPVLHGNNGVVDMAGQGSSYYYSRPRMDITGHIRLGQNNKTVHGLGWFDHQWGDFIVGQLAWDWFSLQLEDGSDIMLYRFRDISGKSIMGNGSVTRKGVTEIINYSDFALAPLAYWHSDVSGVTYPTEWSIKIPKHKVDIIVKAVVENSEFDAKLTTYNIYWEGAITVAGSHKGQGFMELNSYQPNK